MKENNMLKTKPSKSERMFVKYRKVLPNGPLEVLEMDIKSLHTPIRLKKMDTSKVFTPFYQDT
ncbi:hypothetical protein MASR2M117_05190 [Paludibacter sp.]